MNFADYQAAAYRTANHALTADQQIDNAVFGMIGELGEIIDLLKKYRYQGHDLGLDHVTNELGDLLWYGALLATTLGISLDDAAQENIAKLRVRYPGDGFDTNMSRNRSDP